MGNNKNGFTLIELLAVIVVLSIVMVIGATTVLPYMGNAREDAFRLEATNAVKAAKTAYQLYELNQISLKNTPTTSCKLDNGNVCFTVAELGALGVYDGEVSNYDGTIIVSNLNSNKPTYTLNFKKGSEFFVANSTSEVYTSDSVTLNTVDDWHDGSSEEEEDYALCACPN